MNIKGFNSLFTSSPLSFLTRVLCYLTLALTIGTVVERFLRIRSRLRILTILYIHLSTLPLRLAIVLTGNLLLLGNQQLTISTQCTKLMNTWVHYLQYHALELIHKYTIYNIVRANSERSDRKKRSAWIKRVNRQAKGAGYCLEPPTRSGGLACLSLSFQKARQKRLLREQAKTGRHKTSKTGKTIRERVLAGPGEFKLRPD